MLQIIVTTFDKMVLENLMPPYFKLQYDVCNS